MPRPARYFWGFSALSALSACAAHPPARAASAAPPSAPTVLSASLPTDADVPAGPRLFPPLEGSATLEEGQERDGSERLIAYGLRMLSRPNGALEQAREYLPAARGAQALELPTRLGGGFLFYVTASNATLFFRSSTFTGELEPFARVDFDADQVVAGFDRIYVSTRRPDRLIALDAEHGTGLGLGSLPPSPGYGKMAFVDAWFGAVQVPLRGTLVTFDAGSSWRPLSSSVQSLGVQDGQLTLAGPDGMQALDGNGTFSRRDQPAPANDSRESEVAQALRAALREPEPARRARDLSGRQALKLAVLRGFRDSDGTLVVASGGRLLRVRASDGALVGTAEHAYAGGGECSALVYGQGYGFACSDEGRQTTLYAFSEPLALKAVRAFSGARYVSASGNGALVIRGRCGGGVDTGGAYCIAEASGGFREIQMRGDFGVERVAALADGRVAVIVPPRLGAAGFLSLIGRAGKEQRISLKLPKAGPGAQLLEKGLWLDGVVERPDVGLSAWVVGSEPFAGVRVALDGTVTVGTPESSIDRALLSGTHALLVGRTGRTLESTDGGFDWSDVDMPSEFDAGRELRDDARLQGCSDVGCSFGGFVRVGWKTEHAPPRLSVALLPDFTPLPQPGGSRWLVHCEATGEVSEPSSPVSPRPRVPGRADEGTAPWAPFFDARAPNLAAGEVGFDTAGSDSEAAALHVYAWGERGADWTRSGHTQLRALDRFDVSHSAFQSAVTRSPWPDATTAAEAFGFDGTGTPTSWRAVLDAGQRSAAVLTSARGLLDLLLFEEGKTVTHIPNAGRLGLGMLNSVAKLSDAWYGGSFNESRAFTLTRIVGSHVDRLAEYPDAARDQGSLVLVRGTHADELAIWVVARGWFLFPLEPKTYAVQAPLYRSPADLAEMPAPCDADADGFLLDGAPTLEPSLRFAKGAEELAARHVEAQFVWSAAGLCTRALAADTEVAIKRSPSSTVLTSSAAVASKSVPLTVSERRPQGRRWGYACSR